MSAADLVAAIAQADAERIYVARALDPDLRGELRDVLGFEELPFVRGRTVVPEGVSPADIVIAGHPNHLGVFDLPDTRWIAVTGHWSSLQPKAGATLEMAMETQAPRRAAEASLAVAVDLAKRLDQLAGVTVAFPPMSPVVVALLSVDPATVAAGMATPGCTALRYEELPGGLRIDVASEVGAQGYAHAFAHALTDIDDPMEDRWRQQPAP